MIGELINTFRKTTSAFNEKYVRKSQIDRSTCYRVWIKHVNHVFPGYAIFKSNVQKIYTVKNAKMNKYLLHYLNKKIKVNDHRKVSAIPSDFKVAETIQIRCTLQTRKFPTSQLGNFLDLVCKEWVCSVSSRYPSLKKYLKKGRLRFGRICQNLRLKNNPINFYSNLRKNWLPNCNLAISSLAIIFVTSHRAEKFPDYSKRQKNCNSPWLPYHFSEPW